MTRTTKLNALDILTRTARVVMPSALAFVAIGTAFLWATLFAMANGDHEEWSKSAGPIAFRFNNSGSYVDAALHFQWAPFTEMDWKLRVTRRFSPSWNYVSFEALYPTSRPEDRGTNLYWGCVTFCSNVGRFACGADVARVPTQRSINLFVSNWLFLLATGAYPFVSLVRVPIQRWLRCRRMQCLYCGYDLHGNESGTCPECGKTIERRKRA